MKKIRYLSGTFPSSMMEIGKKIDLKDPLEGFRSLLLDEDSSSYTILKTAIDSKGLIITDNLERILFSKEELDSANNLALIVMGKKPIGYPEPRKDDKYFEDVYLNSCKLCGINERQVRPFRLSKIPNWQKNFNWFSINWVYDVSFVNKLIYNEFLLPLGIDAWPVLSHRDGSIIDHIVQLKLPIFTQDLSEYFKDWPSEICIECGYQKPHPKFLDYFPIVDSNLPMALTKEFFGSGNTAQRRVIIRRDVAELFVELKLIKYDTYNLWPSKSLVSE